MFRLACLFCLPARFLKNLGLYLDKNTELTDYPHDKELIWCWGRSAIWIFSDLIVSMFIVPLDEKVFMYCIPNQVTELRASLVLTKEFFVGMKVLNVIFLEQELRLSALQGENLVSITREILPDFCTSYSSVSKCYKLLHLFTSLQQRKFFLVIVAEARASGVSLGALFRKNIAY